MNNNIFLAVGLAVVLALVGVLVGASLASNAAESSLGRAVDYEDAGFRMGTFEAFNDITKDIHAIATSTGHGLRYTGSYAVGTISSSTASSTAVSTAGASSGDFVLVGHNSATSTEQWQLEGTVSGSGTTTLKWFTVPGSTAYTSGLDIAAMTYYIKIFPQDAISILSATSSSP